MLGRLSSARSAAVPSSSLIRETRPWRATRREGQAARLARPQGANRRPISLHRQRKRDRGVPGGAGGEPEGPRPDGLVRSRAWRDRLRRALPQLRRTRGARRELAAPGGRLAPVRSSGTTERPSGAAGPRTRRPEPHPGCGACAKTARSWPGALAAGVIGGAAAALALSWALPRDGAEEAACAPRSTVWSRRWPVSRANRRRRATDHAPGRPGARLGRGGRRDQGQIEALKAADAALQKRLDAFEPGTAGPQVQDLATRLDQLEAAVAAAARGSERGGDRQLAELETKLSDLSATVARLEQATAGDRPELAGLTSRIGALEARFGQAEGRARRSRAWPAASAQ